VNCFKPFKTTFLKKKNNNMVNNNYKELDKIVFTNKVNKAYQGYFQQNQPTKEKR